MFLCGVTLSAEETAVPRSGSQEPDVWFWQSGGSGQRMRLEVQLDQRAIFTTSFTATHTSRSAIPETSHSKAVRFSFRSKRTILWSGYRDKDVISPTKQPIECDIWMAGADDSAIILGVSFAGPDGILINTLHVALPTREERSEIAHGLVIITSPASTPEPNKRMHRTPQ